jgi:hypothetical protein
MAIPVHPNPNGGQMRILSDTAVQSALDYNLGRPTLGDPNIVGNIQELLGIARSEQIDEVFVEAVAAGRCSTGWSSTGR